jgi:hypothetical protein
VAAQLLLQHWDAHMRQDVGRSPDVAALFAAAYSDTEAIMRQSVKARCSGCVSAWLGGCRCRCGAH